MPILSPVRCRRESANDRLAALSTGSAVLAKDELSASTFALNKGQAPCLGDVQPGLVLGKL